ncbi:MAG TPA: hypothetical protein VG759_20430 [Candidatus Angelobacter sp.]|jgi:hypothetical protein|nr:hypothetical protein [Candidatus Angelobacter sp.]
MVHRVFSGFLGLALALAGLMASDYIMIDFKAGLLAGAVGVLVPGVLMLSAFYMAFRFIRFAATGKK